MEVVVVLVILGILMAIAIPSFRSAKGASLFKQSVVAAQSYRDAISQFQLEHGNAVPNAASTSTPEWPAKGPNPTLGPLDFGGRPYLHGGAPEGVGSTAAARVRLSFGAPRGAAAEIVYTTEPVAAAYPVRYELAVYVGNRLRCAIGTATVVATRKVPAC